VESILHHAGLNEIQLPEFGIPNQEPIIPPETYLSRIQFLREKAKEIGFDALVVYGDREHYANIAWLTGFDPRFEEVLLIIDIRKDGKPVLVLGNEGLGYADNTPIKRNLKVTLYQSFSLVSQPRGDSQPLKQILRSGGVKQGVLVGVAGWKYYTKEDMDESEKTLEIPSYIADTIRRCAGKDNIFNANKLLIHPTDGIRAVNDVDQLARFEFIATHTSQALRDVIFNLLPGMTEYDAVRLMRLNGLPLSCHLMLSAGPRAAMGLPSPTSRVIERGDPFTMAYGAWGGLCARAGFVVESEKELPKAIRDYVPKLVAPYFEAVAEWYRKLRIGATGGDLFKAIHDRIGEPFFGVHLNPGHLTSLEEWLSSLNYENSKEKIASGMAIQVDVIPNTGTKYFTTNIEDTLAVADAGLQEQFKEIYPEAWARIQMRRDFMANQLGISLAPEILPFSNIPAYLSPYLLTPRKAMRIDS
jgi:Xaa-Pro aminopeptidase